MNMSLRDECHGYLPHIKKIISEQFDTENVKLDSIKNLKNRNLKREKIKGKTQHNIDYINGLCRIDTPKNPIYFSVVYGTNHNPKIEHNGIVYRARSKAHPKTVETFTKFLNSLKFLNKNVLEIIDCYKNELNNESAIWDCVQLDLGMPIFIDMFKLLRLTGYRIETVLDMQKYRICILQKI